MLIEGRDSLGISLMIQRKYQGGRRGLGELRDNSWHRGLTQEAGNLYHLTEKQS
jgi:hypothetical protein